MPGAYQFDSSAGTSSGQPLSAGIFRPPVSPSASNYNMAKSNGSLYSDLSMATTTPVNGTAIKRKRAPTTREAAPMDWIMGADASGELRHRYNLAGQINATPGSGGGADHGNPMEDSVYSDLDYRRALGPRRITDDSETPPVRQSDPNSLVSNRPSLSIGWSTLALHTIGDVVGRVWEFCKNGAFRGFHAGGGTAYDADGSLTTSTEATETGGTGHIDFQFEQPIQQQQQPNSMDITFDTPNLQTEGLPRRSIQPPPEYTPYSPRFHDMNTPESTPRPAAKRRQVSENTDSLGKNWVMVDDDAQESARRSFTPQPSQIPARSGSSLRMRQPAFGQSSQPAAPSINRRLSVPVSRVGLGSGHNPALSIPRSRTSLRMSYGGSPSPAPSLQQREPASFAQPRSPVSGATTTPSRIPLPVSGGQLQYQPPFASPSPNRGNFGFPAGISSRPSSRSSLRQSPLSSSATISPTKIGAGHHRRNQHSAASLHSRRSIKIGPEVIEASPHLDAEAKQLAQKKLEADRDADAHIDAFNARLLSMIRQGKEALGTTVEVLDDDMNGVDVGGGWEDDDL